MSARLAWPDDAPAMVRVQLTAWREHYADLAIEIDTVDPQELAARWVTTLNSPKDARMRVLVALERADVRGFALVHPRMIPMATRSATARLASS